MMTYGEMSRPLIIIVRASASRIGQYDGGGMWMAAIISRVTPVGRGVGLPPWPSPFFRSQSSARPRADRMTAKVYTGGRERMAPSSVRAAHATGPATVPDRVVFTTLTI